ncbi:MAG: ABC transporter permease [Oscillospiraceae bacterium]|nr:ABC transporter permease [Oscillospiraceae bacterium]
MIALMKRVIRQISGDKRTVAMIIVAPLLILSLVYLLLGGTNYTPKIAMDEWMLPQAMRESFEEQDIEIVDISIMPDFDARGYLLENKDIDAVFSFFPVIGEIKITLYEAGNKGGEAIKAIQSAMARMNPSGNVRTEFVIGDPDESLFDALGYVFLGVISFFLIFIISGMALVRERSAGTLERMMMTPLRRGGVVAGYTLGYGLFAAIQAVILVVFTIYALGIHCNGNIGWVLLIMLMLAVCAVLFGELISIFANTEFQVVQFIPIAIIPQIFFSGLIPLETMPYHLGNLSYIMPIFYGCSGIREVMRAASGFSVIWPYLAALAGYIVVLFILNTLALKKYRKL